MLLRTYVREATRDPYRGAPPGHRRPQRLRDRPPTRRAAHDVREWRNTPYEASPAVCPLCGERSRPIALEAEPYAELLGLYLGDGHITDLARSQRLRLFLDAKFPAIIDDAEQLIHTLLPANRVGRVVAEEGRMTVVWAYSC